MNISELSDGAVDVNQWQEDSEHQYHDLVQELSLLQTRGSELCLAIVGASSV
jgi:hypothetical protein